MEVFVGFFVLTTFMVMYLLPSIVAYVRKHSNFKAIIALNILAGFSGLGWIAAFVWSLTDNVKTGT